MANIPQLDLFHPEETKEEGDPRDSLVAASVVLADEKKPEKYFYGPEKLQEAINELVKADAVVLDFETTSLTLYDGEPYPGPMRKIGGKKIKDILNEGGKIDATPRARILTIFIPTDSRCSLQEDDGYRAAFDLDLLSVQEKFDLASAFSEKIWIGHNIGFDYAWMLTLCKNVRPSRLIDTMLLATTHNPDALYAMQSAIIHAEKNDPVVHDALWKYLQTKMAKRKDDDGGSGSFSLQSLSLLYLNVSLDKEYQKPHNWMLDSLTEEHLLYCMGDVDTPLKIAIHELGLPVKHPEKKTWTIAEILYEIENSNGGKAYTIMEQSLHSMARMHHKGVPWSIERYESFRAELINEADNYAAEILKIAPELGEPIPVMEKKKTNTVATKKKSKNKRNNSNFDTNLGLSMDETDLDDDSDNVRIPDKIIVIDELKAQDKGLTITLKNALFEAINRENSGAVASNSYSGSYSDDSGYDKSLDDAEASMSEEDDGNEHASPLKMDARRLAFDYPNSKLVKLLSALQGVVKERAMLDTFAEHAKKSADGRIHPLTAIVTITGRTSASSPSLQQVPRDPRFRAVFAADKGNKIIATDYSSIELRIAAALGVRSWRVYKKIESIVRETNGKPDLSKKHRAFGAFVKKQIGWIFQQAPELVEYLKSNDVIPPERLREDSVILLDQYSTIADYALIAAKELATWVSRLRKITGGDDEQKLPFLTVYKEDLDPHILTAVGMKAMAGDFDIGEHTPLEYLSMLTKEQRRELKDTFKEPRQAAKAVNFGSLYGQQPTGLHRYGVVGYGLQWTVEDAEMAHDAWFRLYPEIGLWHWLQKRVYIKKNQAILNPYRPTEVDYKGKIYQWTTLSHRTVCSSKVTSASNYQDQGTGAELALLAIGKLPFHVQEMLINFVHDELVLEVPIEKVDETRAVVESTMLEAANTFLGEFGVPAGVETLIRDAWAH